jgi:hypothetical protein
MIGRTWQYVIVFIAAMLGIGGAGATPMHGDDAPWEWRPYQIAIDLEAADSAALPESYIHSMKSDAARRLRERYRTAWSWTDDGEPAEDAAVPEKRFVVQLSYDHDQYEVTVREHDIQLDSISPPIVRRTPQRDAVGELIFAAVAEAFRPTVRIDEARSGTASVRLRAGRLFPSGECDELLRRGRPFLPITRRLDRDGGLLDSLAIPWTLLIVDEPKGDEAVCLVRSGLANPLGVRRRGRTERIAIAVGRPTGGTTIQFTSRDGRPLAGCQVFADRGDEKPDDLGTTDVEGRIFVPADDGRAVMLVAAARFTPLAKLPLVPGLVPAATAATAGEPELLAAEQRLVAWQGKFLDGFIQRRVLLSLAESYVERDDKPAAERLLARIDAAMKFPERRQELDSLARRSSAEAGQAKRAVAAMFAEAEKAIAALDDAVQVADLRKAVAKMKPPPATP